MPSRNTMPSFEAAPTQVTSAGVVAKAAFFLCALPWIFRALARARYWTRRRSLDSTVEKLRTVRRFRWAYLCHPYWLCASVDRVLAVVPWSGFGICFKRSLLLLDLWGRCGLEPRLHLGVRFPGRRSEFASAEDAVMDPASKPAEGHAWVSSVANPAVSTSDEGYAPGFSF